MDISDFPRQYARTKRFTLGVPHAFSISPDGKRVLYLRSRGGEDPVTCLWQLEGGREQLLADPLELGETAASIAAYSVDTDSRTAVFALGGHLWAAGTDGSAPRLVPTAGPPVNPCIDPTGQRVAYITSDALHVVELADGSDRVLAAPEGPDVSYGLPEDIVHLLMERTRGDWWSPDGRRLLVARVDNSRVQRWWISDPANPQTPPRQIAYPAAGTPNADVSLFILGLEGERVELAWDRAAYEYVTTASWDAHGPLVGVQSRDQRTLHVLEADPDPGVTTLLHEQLDPAWVELISGTPARTASGALIHTVDTVSADGAGTRQLLVDGKPVTPLGLQVRDVLGVTGESVLFIGMEEPTEEHLWSYDRHLGRLVRLSDGPGLHAGVQVGATLLLASHTEAGHAFRVVRDGEPDTQIASLDATPVLLPRVTWLSVGERGIRTALVLPSWHRPGAGKLPVLMNPYSGPAMQQVTRARHPWMCVAQWFAEAGFAVVIADGRGTPGRGPVWEKEVYGDTLSPVIEDQVDALHAAAEHCPDLDLERVGIRGWSYGGTLAAAAVIRRPDVFHTAISGAAPSDQRLYEAHWRERFIGLPDEEPEAYLRCSPVAEAASLRRPLLLVHGLADDNVVAAHTFRMSAALLAAGRPHRVLPLSGSAHSPTDETTIAQLLIHQLDFLRETLSVPEH